MKKILIRADGSVKEIVTSKQKKLSLQEMYHHIGCDTVEHISLAKGVDMWIDEEGKLNSLPYNKVATAYFHRSDLYKPELYRKAGLEVDFIVGDAIIEDNTKKGWL